MDEGALRKLVSARTAGRGEGGRNARCARRRHRSRCGVVPVPSGRAESGAAAGSCCGTAGGAPGAPSALFRLCPLARSSRTDIRPFPAAGTARCAVPGGTRCPPSATRARVSASRWPGSSSRALPGHLLPAGIPALPEQLPAGRAPCQHLGCVVATGPGWVLSWAVDRSSCGSGLLPSRGSALGSCFGT